MPNELVFLKADNLELRGDGDAARLAGRIVPFGEPRETPGGIIETWDAKSFGPVDADSIALRNEHRDLIGRGISFETRSDGAYMEFRLGSTSQALEVRTLAAEGILRHLSVGFYPNADLDIRRGANVTRRGADLREVSTVAIPAFDSARVLAVRNERGTMPETNETPAVDDGPENVEVPILAEAGETIVTRAQVPEAFEDRVRALEVRAAETPEYVTTNPAAEFEQRSMGEVLMDMVRAGEGNEDATRRLAPFEERGALNRTNTGVALDLRAFANPADTGGDGVGVVDPAFISDLLGWTRQSEGHVAAIGKTNIPQSGMTISLPLIDAPNVVDYQSAQNAGVNQANLGTDTADFEVAVLAGGQGMSLTLVQRSDPSYLDAVMRDLVSAYLEKQGFETVNGTGIGDNYLGILNVGAPDFPVATADVAGLVAALGDAAASVYGLTSGDGTGRWPTGIGMHPQLWGDLIGATDADGRPLVTVDAPQNPVGIGDATAVGTFRGLPVILDYHIPIDLGAGNDETVVIVSNYADSTIYEDSGAPFTLQLTYPDVLTLDVSVFGHSSLAIRRADAFATISGVPEIP